MTLPILFFFYCYRDHRDLHSFPTRRSSDLAGIVEVVAHDRLVPEIAASEPLAGVVRKQQSLDRKSTRLNSSHQIISYAVFCLKKKKIRNMHAHTRNSALESRPGMTTTHLFD